MGAGEAALMGAGEAALMGTGEASFDGHSIKKVGYTWAGQRGWSQG